MKAKISYFLNVILYCLFKVEQKINILFYTIIVIPIAKFLRFVLPEKWHTESMKNPNNKKQEYIDLANFAKSELEFIIILQCSVFWVPFIIAFNKFIAAVIGIPIMLFILYYTDNKLLVKKQADIIRDFESKSNGWKTKRFIILILWIIESLFTAFLAIFLGFFLESIS